jgi:hypothetical protein
VFSGSVNRRRVKPSSMRLINGSGRARPSASSAVVQARGNSSRASDDPRPDARIHRSLDHRVEQPASVRLAQAGNDELGQASELLPIGWLPYRHDEHNSLGQQPTRNEGDRLCRNAVEPLRVIDQADERSLLGAIGQQIQDREPNQKAIGRFPIG